METSSNNVNKITIEELNIQSQNLADKISKLEELIKTTQTEFYEAKSTKRLIDSNIDSIQNNAEVQRNYLEAKKHINKCYYEYMPEKINEFSGRVERKSLFVCHLIKDIELINYGRQLAVTKILIDKVNPRLVEFTREYDNDNKDFLTKIFHISSYSEIGEITDFEEIMDVARKTSAQIISELENIKSIITSNI